MNPELRDFAIREIGCIASALWAERMGIRRGPVPCEKHHLNEGDQPGRKRRGEKETVGLSEWSHRGICMCAPLRVQTDCPECKAEYGPSWWHHKREFIQTFGDGDTLLAEQNRRIRAWHMGGVVVFP
jgi:hypothetical protein